jgi:hypothetical protein
MPFAMRTCHCTAEKTSVFGRYPEIELEPASRILTDRSVHYSLVAGCSERISADRCLHFFLILVALLSESGIGLKQPLLAPLGYYSLIALLAHYLLLRPRLRQHAAEIARRIAEKVSCAEFAPRARPGAIGP